MSCRCPDYWSGHTGTGGGSWPEAVGRVQVTMRGIEARLRAAAQRPTAPSGGRSPTFQIAVIVEVSCTINRITQPDLRPPGGPALRGSSSVAFNGGNRPFARAAPA